MARITESPSRYEHLEQMSTTDLLRSINAEDRTVAVAVAKCIPTMEPLIDAIAEHMVLGGRLFYIGAGTSGRLGIVDASECPPTFGVPHGMVVGLIAGGDSAIRKAVEFAEDDTEQGWKDLQEHEVGTEDTVIGIAASGGTPYVVGALKSARAAGVLTGCITCNPDSPVTQVCDHPLVAVVGPEFVTGSTRMKSGTAQKLILNMISTTVMIKLGRVKGNRMVDMQLSNNKLVDRGTRMVMDDLGVDYDTANALLKTHGSVRKAVENGR
ncbi:MAG: N-acetylmuramic acid 6-phosphate etherase [Flavobacteriales bacterium]|nr:N-acetylmuramic acid 6-phosphate etherase [Flavobacteriales bacterium]MBK6891876.1 N-acetylmuramic acid 6-phosphate etherase [Flavobacteriales bacterium]MBK7248485.1 N-acetylmuramic acid 6-phosphate etherase [Flavobacteriales bacterium]MBK7288138.1 N-acetylmuramic acid 6-phosphate etherase [Flavobacteriales bacterium]MBK9059296.1 N-acetylmuramic acid 6-phosphate etherase [Flavobacteriales bacterium]